MADESIRNPRSAMEVIRHGAADIANVYVTEAGGLLNAAKIFAMCEAAGMPCMIGSMPEFGIGTAAQIHLGVAMTNLGPDSDTCGVLYHQEDLLEDAAADRGRLLLSARRTRSRRRDRHEDIGILESRGGGEAVGNTPMPEQQPQSLRRLIVRNGCVLTMDARRTIIPHGAVAISGHTIAAVGAEEGDPAGLAIRQTSSTPRARSSIRVTSMRICT